jgi:hypothetical protein
MWHLCHTGIATTLHFMLGRDIFIRPKLHAAFAKHLPL